MYAFNEGAPAPVQKDSETPALVTKDDGDNETSTSLKTSAKSSIMHSSTSLDMYPPIEQTEGAPTPVIKDKEDQHFQFIDRKISELERNLVARTNILDKAKVLSKLGNSSLIGKSKQEKASY
jgi:hypothetical protein